VLLTADGVGTNEIMRRTDTSKVTVWRWQERFMRAGIAGRLRDKTLGPMLSDRHDDLNRDRGTSRDAAHRVTGGGRPPPVPTERSVQISRTTLFRR
jgi:Homeodomain-like domain